MLSASEQAEYSKMFSFDGDANIIDERDFGIFDGMATVGVNYRDVGSIAGFFAPPFASTDFLLETRLFGEKVSTHKYTWYPFEVTRNGRLNEIRVTTSTTLIYDTRACLISFTIENTSKQDKAIPIQFSIKGGLEYVNVWRFGRPNAVAPTQNLSQPGKVIKHNESGAIVVQTDIEELKWFDLANLWEGSISLKAGESRIYHIATAIGEQSKAEEECRLIISDPETAIAGARAKFTKLAADMMTKLPTLEASDKKLVDLYNRSILHFLLHRWEVPEFLLHPSYTTGSILGGCLANYLWNYGETWEILPLYDPQGDKEHIKHFLSEDMTAHHNFNPLHGEAMGPWYPVNQEKLIYLVYYYVLFTGDTAFLDEEVNGKTVCDHIVFHATYGDDPTQPVALVDYGPKDDHLELRRGIKYIHYLPDLNARRYANYSAAYKLTEIAGKPLPFLLDRADQIKKIVKKEMWSPQDKWFYFIDADGTKDIRYTCQMFYLLDSPVLDAEAEEGLLSHLNEEEFLGAYGIHSMSKKDIAYDQVDIDNGGGGICTSFPAHIIEKLYRSGHPDKAEDIIRRILWWGQRMPYWGDSIVANQIDYRKDTPLQCTIDGVAIAQGIIFGMFGVEVKPNGDTVINPTPPEFSPEIKLRCLKLQGHTIDISVKGEEFMVRVNGKTVRAKVGMPVVLNI